MPNIYECTLKVWESSNTSFNEIYNTLCIQTSPLFFTGLTTKCIITDFYKQYNYNKTYHHRKFENLKKKKKINKKY
jgi:hypothetical protein